MTARPLTDDFPMRSALVARAPWQVPADELRLELDEELACRRRVYPGLVARGSLAADDAERQLAVWRAMIADHRRADGLPAELYTETWEARVRELRRELALRRNAYPKWVASPTNPLTAADATRRLERLDALHWRYWMELFAFASDATPPRADPRLAHHVALRELARREAALDAGERNGGAGAALAARIRNHLIVAGRIAAVVAAGREWRSVVEGRADVLRIARTADALCAAVIDAQGQLGDRATDPVIAQLYLLHLWLTALPDQPAAPAAAIPERLAA